MKPVTSTGLTVNRPPVKSAVFCFDKLLIAHCLPGFQKPWLTGFPLSFAHLYPQALAGAANVIFSHVFQYCKSKNNQPSMNSHLLCSPGPPTLVCRLTASYESHPPVYNSLSVKPCRRLAVCGILYVTCYLEAFHPWLCV